jgi:hypothetical protein
MLKKDVMPFYTDWASGVHSRKILNDWEVWYGMVWYGMVWYEISLVVLLKNALQIT